MLKKPPQLASGSTPLAHIHVAWPKELLYENSKFIGFLMPKINKSPSIFEVYHPGTRKKKYPEITGRHLYRVARNLATVFSSIHTAKYIIGDVNQKNILVTTNSLVTIVDVDSFQVYGINGIVYRCPVGVLDYTPPELQGKRLDQVTRSEENDRFGLAVLIFQLLMNGRHPFTGTPKRAISLPLTESIQKGYFAYQSNNFLKPPKDAPAFSNLNPDLQQLFINCFINGYSNPQNRPTATNWQNQLRMAENNLKTCSNGHWYSNHLQNCPTCPTPQKKNTPPSLSKPTPPILHSTTIPKTTTPNNQNLIDWFSVSSHLAVSPMGFWGTTIIAFFFGSILGSLLWNLYSFSSMTWEVFWALHTAIPISIYLITKLKWGSMLSLFLLINTYYYINSSSLDNNNFWLFIVMGLTILLVFSGISNNTISIWRIIGACVATSVVSLIFFDAVLGYQPGFMNTIIASVFSAPLAVIVTKIFQRG